MLQTQNVEQAIFKAASDLQGSDLQGGEQLALLATLGARWPGCRRTLEHAVRARQWPQALALLGEAHAALARERPAEGAESLRAQPKVVRDPPSAPALPPPRPAIASRCARRSLSYKKIHESVSKASRFVTFEVPGCIQGLPVEQIVV